MSFATPQPPQPPQPQRHVHFAAAPPAITGTYPSRTGRPERLSTNALAALLSGSQQALLAAVPPPNAENPRNEAQAAAATMRTTLTRAAGILLASRSATAPLHAQSPVIGGVSLEGAALAYARSAAYGQQAAAARRLLAAEVKKKRSVQ